VRRGTGGQPVPTTVREAVADLRTHLNVRQDLLGRRFRSTRVVRGSEHPDPRPPAPTRPVARAEEAATNGSTVDLSPRTDAEPTDTVVAAR